MCQQTVKPTKYNHTVQVTYAEAFHRRPRLVLKCHFGTHLTAFFGLRVNVKRTARGHYYFTSLTTLPQLLEHLPPPLRLLRYIRSVPSTVQPQSVLIRVFTDPQTARMRYRVSVRVTEYGSFQITD
jgi:hypothetical protein